MSQNQTPPVPAGWHLVHRNPWTIAPLWKEGERASLIPLVFVSWEGGYWYAHMGEGKPYLAGSADMASALEAFRIYTSEVVREAERLLAKLQ